ncbi:stage V sporulation protein AA [Gracilibacillus halotolerans]|uniref:Stage V sporulation protein AA n=1 Tax=Gracilibacillus halotolerans TaxID=74386 RepID=A0A841RCM4_9BACI|nr:stage V sporulation protein AA [Gracilibacillus halotolerans]MBB6511700.1 stage V sporulation protein AA [Gracilibacillus halotolerans]
MSEEKIYIRLKKKVSLHPYQLIRMEDLAYLTGNKSIIKRIKNFPIYQITKSDKNYVVIDGFYLLEKLTDEFPHITFDVLGTTQVIVEIKIKKKQPKLFVVLPIWILLCIGSAMAIMNFHYDVNMPQVHQGLYRFLTGEEVDKPLWIQIPYSIGLGAGMILFFNHVFKKKFNEEPSPMEIEMFNYQQDLDNYVIHHENELMKKDNDPKS